MLIGLAGLISAAISAGATTAAIGVMSALAKWADLLGASIVLPTNLVLAVRGGAHVRGEVYHPARDDDR